MEQFYEILSGKTLEFWNISIFLYFCVSFVYKVNKPRDFRLFYLDFIILFWERIKKKKKVMPAFRFIKIQEKKLILLQNTL